MNLIKIGNYIMTKRKELTLTQEQLAEKVSVTSKTISKWECGKSLPDHNIIELLCNIFYISRVFSGTIMIIIFIFIGSLFTALGFFDKLVYKFKCGLLIPITGFAHSMTSASLDYKNEGLIYGIGSNIFKMSGSVILYGIVSAWFFGMIRYIIGG